jgi:hypothetical protein
MLGDQLRSYCKNPGKRWRRFGLELSEAEKGELADLPVRGKNQQNLVIEYSWLGFFVILMKESTSQENS